MSDALEHLARLAGLELDPADEGELRRHLALLQTLIDALPPVEEVPAGTRGAPRIPLRSDRPDPPLAVDLALRGAPARDGDWLECPPVGEDTP